LTCLIRASTRGSFERLFDHRQLALVHLGPRTQQGKEKSKYNSVKHGIFCRAVVINGESRAEFEDLLNGLRNDLQPEGTLEEILVEKLAALFWREHRLIIADGEANIRNGIDFLGLNERPQWDHLLR